MLQKNEKERKRKTGRKQGTKEEYEETKPEIHKKNCRLTNIYLYIVRNDSDRLALLHTERSGRK